MHIQIFEETVLHAICNLLGETATGLIGSEIRLILRECGIDDPLQGYTMRDQLFNEYAAENRTLESRKIRVIEILYP
jgi:hypothetical protein